MFIKFLINNNHIFIFELKYNINIENIIIF